MISYERFPKLLDANADQIVRAAQEECERLAKMVDEMRLGPAQELLLAKNEEIKRLRGGLEKIRRLSITLLKDDKCDDLDALQLKTACTTSLV